MKFNLIYFAIFRHNFKSILISFILVLLLVFGQVFLGFDNDMHNNLIQLFGGIGISNSIIFGLIKLVLISVIILQTSKTIDTLQSNFTQFLCPRLSKRTRLFLVYYLFIVFLVACFMIIFYSLIYLLVNFSDYLMKYLTYVFIDIVSVISMITLFLVGEIIFKFTHSLLIIIGIYILNLFLPFTNLIAINTSKFGGLINGELGFNYVISSILVSILIILFSVALFVIKRREIGLC